MKRVISFSLWGNHPKYDVGAIENAKLAKIFYPGWVAVFYVGHTTSLNVIQKLQQEGAEVIIKRVVDEWSGLFWRYSALLDSTIEVCIFRDTDSRLSPREKNAVDDWLSTKYNFHVMRDHPQHNCAILGGMWGIKKYLIPTELQNRMTLYTYLNCWGADQRYLHDVIWPLITGNVLIHDEIFEVNKPFPTDRINYEFVGDVFDEFNERDPIFWKVLKSYLNSPGTKIAPNFRQQN